MSGSRARRVMKELADIEKDTESGITVEPLRNDDLTHLVANVRGPQGTPYEGGTFELAIEIPDRYPFKAPKIAFRTSIWHPNISSTTGAICLDTLKNGWSPVQTISVAILSCQSLLESPEPKDPQDHMAAKMMLENPQEFFDTAREWAVRHARAPPELSDSLAQVRASLGPGEDRSSDAYFQGYPKGMVREFLNMGFSIEQIIPAFRKVGIVQNNGVDYLPRTPHWQTLVAQTILEQNEAE